MNIEDIRWMVESDVTTASWKEGREAIRHLLKIIDGEVSAEPVTIVAAAIRALTGEVYSLPRPARHHNVIELMWDKGVEGRGTQGFLCSDGDFVERVKAGHLAVAAGQIKGLRWPPQLYSEDLW